MWDWLVSQSRGRDLVILRGCSSAPNVRLSHLRQHTATQTILQKLRAKVGDKARFKLAVLLESHTSMENELPASTFEPYNEHFKTYHKTSKAKHPLPVLNKFLPLQKRIVETEEEQEVLEFLARNLFVHRSKPWVEVLK